MRIPNGPFLYVLPNLPKLPSKKQSRMPQRILPYTYDSGMELKSPTATTGYGDWLIAAFTAFACSWRSSLAAWSF